MYVYVYIYIQDEMKFFIFDMILFGVGEVSLRPPLEAGICEVDHCIVWT